MRGLALEELEIWRGEARLVAMDLLVAPGEVLTVMGRSGSGKSTLLSAIIGDLAPAFRLRGRVRLDGRDISAVPTRARRVGILFQDDVLFPHLSIGGNLLFAVPPSVRRRERRARVEAALAAAGLEGMAERDPATLSGGQRTRVALMRMLLAEPRALLLDEPFSGLDAARRDSIRAFVFARAVEAGVPVILVSHDPDDARAAGGRVVTPLGQACGV